MRAPELNLPPEADAIVARAMAKAREDRYANAAEVQADLEAAIVGQRRLAASAPPPETVMTARPAGGDRLPASTPTIPVREEVSQNQFDGESDSDSDAVVGGERLRRQEFDAFEHSLHRKKVFATLIVPTLLVIGAGLGVWAFGRSREKASSVEREPNNAAREATLLPLDTPVQGTVGARLSEGQPDMDYFRVPGGQGFRAISARVEGIPDVDLVLELFDAQGVAIGKSDSHGTGAGEWLQPIAVGPAEAYLLVRQVWIQGTPPVENVANPYRLAVHWGQPLAGWETEPNDWPERATAVDVGRAVKGYLGSAEDKDWFVFTPTVAGFLTGRITPPDGVEIVMTVGDTPGSGRGLAGKGDKGGEIKLPVAAGQRTLIGFARKLVAGGDTKSAALVGLDSPYELKIGLRAP